SSGEAIAAWVRYSDDLLVVAPPPVIPFYQWSTSCAAPFYLCPITPPVLIKPDLPKTTIAVRRIDPAGTIPGQEIQVISDPGINIQPSISVSPSGNTAYAVWVHDPIHSDLLESNRGRTLKVAIYDKPTDSWSAPFDAVETPDDFPALLEPSIVLTGEDDGMLVFTALPASTTSLRDTGLGGGSRFLYASRLIDGAFQEPVKIRGRCDARVYSWAQEVFLLPDTPVLVHELEQLTSLPPELILTWQEYGPAGTASGSGNRFASVFDAETGGWSDALQLYPDGTVLSNMAASVYRDGLHSIHFVSGLADPRLTLAGPVAIGFQVVDTPLLPDPAITECRLEHAMAGPGVIVNGIATVENLGFLSTPLNPVGESVLGLEVVLLDDDEGETIVATVPLPVLGVGAKTDVAFAVEMPLDPVRLVTRLLTGDVDRDPSNNVRECFFGAPAPRNLTCDVRVSSIETQPDFFCVEIDWVNPTIYDCVLVYRDGTMIHRLPGSANRFVDLGVVEGTHVYEIRGMIEASRSRKSGLTCEVVPPSSVVFLRGDVNGDGTGDIADVIASLDYQFLEGDLLGCLASADVNGDGSVAISDVIYQLSYLFQGGTTPPGPFPRCGVSDSVTDGTLGCEVPGC
ncbi:MAG: dockerin type I repeat-containing protein, partial [Planctomycetes bacterium]|nr:dockerin type I repeat-containing protein [Planctomycetota bacterium]